MPVDRDNPNHVRPDGSLTILGEMIAQESPSMPSEYYHQPGTYIQSPLAGTAPPEVLPPVKSLPVLYVEPTPQPVIVKRLSLDGMIGIFALLFLLAFSPPSLNLLLWGGGIGLTVWAWRWLRNVAPVTAQVILIFFGIVLLGLLSLLGGGFASRGRRRW